MGRGGALLVAALAIGSQRSPSEEALRYFTPEEISRGAAFARQRRALWLGSLVWSAAILAVLSHPGVGGRLVRAARRLAGDAAPQAQAEARDGPVRGGASRGRGLGSAAIAVALLVGLHLLAQTPFAWARGFLLERAWGLSTQGAAGFLWDWAKGLALNVALTGAALWIVVAVRSALPGSWPLAAWGATAALLVAYVFLAPVLVDPLFNRFTPVTEPELRERALSVASRAGVNASDVLWVDASRRTRRTNAYFTGLGATKRIVLYDNLKAAAAPDGRIPSELLDELEVILAHEAAHWARAHVWKGTALAVAAFGLFFAILWLVLDRSGAWAVPAALPEGARVAPVALLVASVLSFLLMPAANAVSRSWERSCDADSLALTGKREAYVRAEVELARRNISEIEPSRLAVFWLYSHPPVLERIRLAEEISAPAR